MMDFAARLGSAHWIMDAIARGLIWRAIWAVTRGMPAGEIIALAVVACLAVVAWRRT
jgi:hypothetical protein